VRELTRRQFGKTLASGLAVLSSPMGLGVPITQAHPVQVSSAKREYSFENKLGISLVVNSTEGAYTVRYGGERWLGRGLVSVLENKRWYRSAEGCQDVLRHA